jgi:putative membrane protein
LLGIAASPDIWRFQPHVEVWVLVAGLALAYTYAIKVIGPRVVRPGKPVVTRGQVACFVGGLSLLWLASDWPMHDLSEEYLYSAHMLQHMVLSYFMPPLLLLATPTWLARLLVGNGRVWQGFRWLAKPVVAGVIFNAMVIVSHIPAVVNEAVTSANPALHYGLHTVLVLSALLMWVPVCGPFPELRMGPGGTMIYLFAMSIIPTVPAGWLTFADGAVYKAYDHEPRLWGITVTDDQQMAGAIMKVGGSLFLWTVIAVLFFRRFMGNWEEQNTYVRSRRIPDAEVTGHDELPLTYEDVTRVFDTVPPAAEPERPPGP